MLEQMRKNSQSLLIYVLFAIVIAVFIINFGPQSQGSSCEQVGGNDHYAAKVAGETITTNSFRYGFMLMGGAQIPPRMAKQERFKELVMDKLIERELLAAEAERLGFSVTQDEVEDQIADAKIVGLGATHTVPRLQKDGHFNYDAFKSFLQVELGISPKNFIEEQKRELLALRVRDLLRSGVGVSEDEVKAEFLRKNRQVNLEYMRFAGRKYEGEITFSEAELSEYAAKNEAKLKEAYEQKKFVYEKVPPQRRLWQILVKAPQDASADVEKAARQKAEALAERLRKGAKATGKGAITFAELARQASEDVATKGRGGDLGWRAKGATNLTGESEEKVWSAKSGSVVGPLRGTEGFVITKVEGNREGNVSFEQAKLELAEEKLREERANARAKEAAASVLAKAKGATTTPLKTMFPAPSDADEASASAPGAPPRVEETGLFSLRAGREGAIVEGIGVSNEVAKAAFALTPESPVAGPFEVGGGFVVIRLKEKKEPDLADLERRKLELVREAEVVKGERVLGDWTQARCAEAKAAKDIRVNLDVLRYEDSNDVPEYEPCTPRRMFGG